MRSFADYYNFVCSYLTSVSQDWEHVIIDGIEIRGWVYECINYGPDIDYTPSMHYRNAFKLVFKDLKTLLRIENKHSSLRRLALAMALHPRLGKDSQLSVLGDQFVWAVAYVKQFSLEYC